MQNDQNPVNPDPLPPLDSTNPTRQTAKPKKTDGSKPLFILLSVVALISISVIAYYLYVKFVPGAVPIQPGKPFVQTDRLGELVIEKFKNKEEFVEYLAQSDSLSSGGFGLSTTSIQAPDVALAPASENLERLGTLGTPKDTARVSTTNVQVMGIDEPDIVKTDGDNIYYSSSSIYHGLRPEPILFDELSVSSSPSTLTAKTRIISALPTRMKELSSFLETGDLLLYGNTLIVFAGDRFLGFDVSDPANPLEIWQHELEDRNQVITSRLFGDKLYVITASYVDRSSPCPIPVLRGNTGLIVPCTDIFRPDTPSSIDSVHTIMQVNPKTGSIDKKASFVASENSSIVYMSPSAIYLSYDMPVDTMETFLNFFVTKLDDILPTELANRLKVIAELDISSEAKMVEFQKISEDYEVLFEDQREVVEKRMEDYFKEKARDMSKTGIVKIAIDDLGMEASATVPGSLLNQFSMDEYMGNLRVATTVGGNVFGSSDFNENDLYILGPKLDLVGSVKGMGVDERIYSVRFIGDKGYIVTFRQIDPFYVLDLSDPANPEIKGELKIPGYSSYLHPVDTNKILGVGKEGSKVKLSLFGVTNPSSPVEVSKLMLDDYSSEVLNNHHAFLHDPDHKVFFMPGGNKAYVFSYAGDDLVQKLEVDNISAQRALYINDNLYIVGRDKILVFDENTWEEVSELELK